MGWIKSCIIAAVIMFAANSAGAVGPYRVTNLGTLAGATNSDARGINASGQVVGRSETRNGFRAFLWSPSQPNGTTGSMIDLGVLADGYEGSEARSINSAGQIVGDSDHVGAVPRDGFLWTPHSPNGTAGSMINLGDFGGPLNSTISFAVNSRGQATGGSYSPTGVRAFIWNPSSPNSTTGSMIALDGVPNGVYASQGHDINSKGQDIGSANDPSDPTNSIGFLWTPTTPNGTTGWMVTLGDLPDEIAGNSSQPLAINDSGQIVGAYGGTTISTHAFLWSPLEPNGTNGEMIDLGTLPGTGYSRGLDINSQGQVVGLSTDNYNFYRAFIWMPTTPNSDVGTMLDLNSLMHPETRAGWTLGRATGINDLGQIVGEGVYNPDGPGGIDGVGRAYLLTPVPEPSTIFMAAFGIALLATTARHRWR